MPALVQVPWWLRWERICLQCRRLGFDPWVGKIPWRRAWQPTPVFLPGKSHRQGSLVVYSPRGCKESDMTEQLTLYNPMDCSPPGSSVHDDSPGKNTGVGCHALLQGNILTQESNPSLLHCRRILYHLSYQGSLGGTLCKVKAKVAQLFPPLCDSIDCSPPGSSVHRIPKAGIP